MQEFSNSSIPSISYESKLYNHESFKNSPSKFINELNDLKSINQNKECDNEKGTTTLLESKQKTRSENSNLVKKSNETTLIAKLELEK